MTDTAESIDPGPMIFSADTAAAPHETYDTVRRTCPVARSDFAGSTTVYISRYEDVCWAMRHPEYFSSEDTMQLGEQPLIPLQVDPPLHTQYRRFLNPRFVPREIERISRQTLPLLARPHPTTRNQRSSRSWRLEITPPLLLAKTELRALRWSSFITFHSRYAQI